MDPRPNRPASLGRLLTTTLWLALPGMVTLPVLQVLAVRVVTPVPTLTMLEHELEARLEGDRRPFRYAPLALEQAGPVPRAVISAEDGRFHLHRGFDRDGICAAWKANREGGRLRGGSTITQQVARNAFLFQRRSWTRKVVEAGYTVLLELLVPKDRILALYLSLAETGPGVYGFEAGAQHWYGKPAGRLRPTEAGRLVHLLPDPQNRRPNSARAAKKAAWIQRNLAPMPGGPGFERMQERQAARSWWPPCPD